jgi:S-adenosylmethionine:tRNA ribosyltransferase-isomerase
MKRSDFHFLLPPELIAQHPAPSRDGARLLVVDPREGRLAHHWIKDLPDLIPPETFCVPNDVKVRRARLHLRRAGGGAGEALLLRAFPDGSFEAMVRPGSKLKPGKLTEIVDPGNGIILGELTILDSLEEGLRRVSVHREGHRLDWDEVDRIGRLPLPPYIEHLAEAADEERYQTVFRADSGEAVAAPTAGLHFTEDLIARLLVKGCGWHPVRLHVGLGTFRPMTAEYLDEHPMHEERYEIPEETSLLLEPLLRLRNRPLMCIGTTSLRTLESAWNDDHLERSGNTRLFIRPGYRIRTADHLLTNFHLPESTLFVLICAILGLGFAKEAYAEAVRERYRFFSYGDAMLIRNLR